MGIGPILSILRELLPVIVTFVASEVVMHNASDLRHRISSTVTGVVKVLHRGPSID